MGKNLKYQFFNAIDSAFGKDAAGGIDKAEYKKSMDAAGPADKVFSFQEQKNLKDLAADFSNFLKGEYGVKNVSDVTPDMCQKFLCDKAQTCTNATLGTRTSQLRKISTICESRYKSVEGFRKDIITPPSEKGSQKYRDIPMSNKDLADIRKQAEKQERKEFSTASRVGLELGARFGFRDKECVSAKTDNVKFNPNGSVSISVKGKGGRWRTITSNKPGDVEFLKKAVQKAEQNGKDTLCRGIKKDTLNRYLGRLEEEVGCRDKYKDKKTGMHSVRKNRAENYFKEQRDKGRSREKAISDTMVYLGHGATRKDLVKRYLSAECLAYVPK